MKVPDRTIGILAAAIVVAVLFRCGPVLSQALKPLESAAALSPGPVEKPLPPGGIPFGPMIVFPAIDAAIGHNDNLFSSNLNKASSTQISINPSVLIDGRSGPHSYSAAYRIDDVRYVASPADNYTNHTFQANANLFLSGRAGLRLRGEFRRAVDPRGSTDRTVSDVPDEYLNYGIDGIFSYGSPGAKGRIEIDAAAYARRYQNNRIVTAASDRNSTALGGTFLWRVAPKTELLALFQHRRIDYLLNASGQDSAELRYQVGAKWEATAKTTGIVKYGVLQKKFDSSGRVDFSGAAWEAAVRWNPLTYSTFDFATSKTTNESTGTGDFLLTQLHGVTWSHAWNSRFSTIALANWRKDEFLGTGGGRIDKTSTVGVKFGYQWRRWIRFGGEYTVSDRVSDPGTFDYTRHLWMFTVGATL